MTTNTTPKTVFAPDAIQLACSLIAQAQGDTAKARRATQAAVLWMQQRDVDPTYKPDFDEVGSVEVLNALKGENTKLQAGVEVLTQERERFKTLSSLAAKQLAEAQAEYRKLSDEVEQLKYDKAELSASLAGRREDNAKISKVAAERHDEIKALQAEIDNLPEHVHVVTYDDAAARDSVSFATEPTEAEQAQSYIDQPPTVFAEAVERNADELTVVEAGDVVMTPAEAVPTTEAAAADEDEFAHLPPLMREWARKRKANK